MNPLTSSSVCLFLSVPHRCLNPNGSSVIELSAIIYDSEHAGWPSMVEKGWEWIRKDKRRSLGARLGWSGASVGVDVLTPSRAAQCSS